MEKIFLTELKAIHPETGELVTWCGPRIKALTKGLAQEYCQKNELGYLTITGTLVYEVDIEGNNEKDYLDTQLN